MKLLLFMLASIVGLSGCATNDDLRILRDETRKAIDGKTEQIDGIYKQIREMELKRQELSTNMATLELQGAQNSSKYESLKKELASLESKQATFMARLESLERQGRISSEQLSRFGSFFESERKRTSEIMREHNRKWQEIGKK